jgi:transcriptional regulator of acetoin/glycerol metabolism
VSRAALSAPGHVIREADLEFLHLDRLAIGGAAGLPTLRDAERGHVQRVLDAVGWNKKEAARVLDISRGTLYRRIEDYGLVQTMPQFRTDR